MDLAEVLDRSRSFYSDHDLPGWSEALPGQLGPPASADPVLREAAHAGFSRAFAFPPFALQMAELAGLIEACARKPAVGLPDNQQYREPFLADTWTKTPNGKVLQRTDELWSRSEPYVLLLSPSPCKTAWGRTGKQIAELFEAKGWQGLTVPEYLVLQRVFCEQFGDHRFFEEPQDESTAHWLWLVDSMTEADMSVAFGSSRGINLQACKLGNRDSRRAAVAALVLSLAE